MGASTVGAYVVGGLARAAVVHAQIARLAGAASKGFSEHALESVTADAGALALARRFDPYAAAGTPESDREDRIAAFGDELEARRVRGLTAADQPLRQFAKAELSPPALSVSPARPFRLRGVLEESRDLECLTQAVYYEARGEGAQGEAAVAQVVLNRTRHPLFPKTICGVVYQGAGSGPCQFSFACDGSARRRVEGGAWRQAEHIAARALDGFVMAEVGNATHFHVANLATNWGPRLMRVAQVGAHVFYRFGGRAGSGSAFRGEPQPSEPAAPAPSKPVYASLSLAPLASTVAQTVAGAAQAGAELVMAAAQPKAAQPAKAAEPSAAAAAAPANPAVAPRSSAADEAVKAANAT